MLNASVLNERTVTFKQSVHLQGKPSRRQLIRWAYSGIITPGGKRVFLERAKMGGTVYTSHEAYQRFLDLCNGAVSVDAGETK